MLENFVNEILSVRVSDENRQKLNDIWLQPILAAIVPYIIAVFTCCALVFLMVLLNLGISIQIYKLRRYDVRC
jgi:hypothetical protein